MAIDAGTGSGRAIIYDLTGTVIGTAQKEWTHSVVEGVPGALDFATQANGELIDRVIAGAIADAKLTAEDIAAVSTTSMREGFVLYDEAGEVLWACPNIDGRAREQAEKLTAAGVSDEVFRIGGDWVSLTAPARLLWIKEHLPELFAKACHMGMLSDWMATRLTGTYCTEPSAGSSSALFNLEARDWCDTLFEATGLDRAIEPPVVESGEIVGRVTEVAAKRSGLAAGTPVVAGGADTQLALLGLGRTAGQATLVGGSFWQMTVLTERPLIDPDRAPRTLCHARPEEWMTEGIGFLTGFALRWVRDAYFEPILKATGSDLDAFDLIEKLASEQPPGAGGVVATTAAPMQSDNWHQPPLSFLGFDLNSPDPALGQVARAVMEAGAFLSHAHLRRLEALSGKTYDTLQFTGGSAQGTIWPQIVADVTGRIIEIPVVKETTALGCAMLAAVGAGLFASTDEAFGAMASPIERTITPNPENTARYRDIENRWAEATMGTSAMAECGLFEPIWRPAGARSNTMTPIQKV
ncbi:FGGY family carbohydrate kinase [Roseovarius sp. MMSF_3281]|uniref:FGGY family carbohydrate kinase n=1 Tax=Roseovarius sp. MMSF_3281 TaxID=3046694 RepID=UPI0027400FB3|nr:FGGY family carbohydrate kinase [Roseovarius sp. MMSF_3281]